MIRTLTARARRRSLPRALVVRFALRRSRQLAGVRELPKACMVRALAAARTEIATAGAQLADLGRLDAADDVFHLDLVEAHRALDGADLRRLVARRKEAYTQELRRGRVPRVLLSDGTEPEAAAAPPTDGRLLRGTPASAGTVTGVARVVLDPVGARLDPGELLVAPSTDPGWTPLFLTAGGLVMEMGGANSHGAVVAREYGIPAVVGVPGATEVIATGDQHHRRRRRRVRHRRDGLTAGHRDRLRHEGSPPQKEASLSRSSRPRGRAAADGGADRPGAAPRAWACPRTGHRGR